MLFIKSPKDKKDKSHVTGRKLIDLAADSTIWIKFRQEHDGNREIKGGAGNPIYRLPVRDSEYNRYN